VDSLDYKKNKPILRKILLNSKNITKMPEDLLPFKESGVSAFGRIQEAEKDSLLWPLILL